MVFNCVQEIAGMPPTLLPHTAGPKKKKLLCDIMQLGTKILWKSPMKSKHYLQGKITLVFNYKFSVVKSVCKDAC